MLKFSADTFFALGVLIQKLKEQINILESGDPAFSFNRGVFKPSGAVRSGIENVLQQIEGECKKVALDVSERLAQELGHDLQIKDLQRNYILGRISSLETAIQSELQGHLFLYVPEEPAKWYLSPKAGWDQAIGRFRAIVNDVEEAAYCYACDRYAGAVFHAMQIAEVGAVEIGKLIEIRDPKPGWPATIREMQRIVHRAKYDELKPIEKKHRPLLTQLLPIMESMQEGWRHKISHVENRLVLMTSEFQPKVAEEILIDTRAFMRRLATDLPADPFLAQP